jgi:signal transduction histidine kinase
MNNQALARIDRGLLRLLAAALMSTVLILTITIVDRPSVVTGVPDIDSVYLLSTGEARRTALNLRSADVSFTPLAQHRTLVDSRYAYLWIRLVNHGLSPASVVIANQTRNYYTELVAPHPTGAITLFMQGDTVPVSQTPFRHHRAAFPVLLEPGATAEFVIEYHGPRGIVVDPLLLTPAHFISGALYERSLIAFLAGCFVAILVWLLAMAIRRRKAYMLSAVAFVSALFLFSLRQSRVLLLFIDPWVYPEWLFPFTIGLNILVAIDFSSRLMGRYSNLWQRRALQGLALAVVALMAAGFIAQPYQMADLLNLLGLVVLVLVFSLAFKAFRAGDDDVPLVGSAFIPWIATMVADIITGFSGQRGTMLMENRQAFGLLTSLFLLTVALEMMYGRHLTIAGPDMVTPSGPGPTKSRASMAPVDSIEHATIQGMVHQMRQVLYGISASARLLERRFQDPGIVAAANVIISDTGVLEALCANVLADGNMVSGQADGPDDAWSRRSLPESDQALQLESQSVEMDLSVLNTPSMIPPLARILVFSLNLEMAARTGRILCSQGFAADIVTDVYRVHDTVLAGEFDMIIVDVQDSSDIAFALCGQVRAERNMLEMPILLVLHALDKSLIERGYAAGVDDFLLFPLNPLVLAARLQSLMKLKQVYEHNVNLARVEREKNAFLYFLTHNVNTPLTVLVNRIQDLEAWISMGDSAMDATAAVHGVAGDGTGDMTGDGTGDMTGSNLDESATGLRDIIDDIHVTSMEISEIVQNVLISFRLSDGRATVHIGPIDLAPVMAYVDRELRRKAVLKQQALSIELPADLPRISADAFSIRNVIYNLVDNAIKFTPPGGTIHVVTGMRSPDTVDIKVSDSGPGIPEHERDRLFKRFETFSVKPSAGESSTGLGLYVARELARLNGGILVHVDEGVGACFVLTLPVWRSPAS